MLDISDSTAIPQIILKDSNVSALVWAVGYEKINWY